LVNFYLGVRFVLYGIILLLANALVCLIPTSLGISQFLWYNRSMPIHNTLAFGADPVTMQWSVVRGDTGTLRVEFYESNEVDFYDTTGWIFRATAYDQSGNVLDALDCEPGEGFVDITAYPSVTKNWGSKYSSVVAQLPFDLQVIIPEEIEDIVWTPVIGTIQVLGDVTPGGTL
jgi:hypothetical protein